MHFTNLPLLDHPDVLLRPIEEADLLPWAAYLQKPQVYEHTSWNLQDVAELRPFLWREQLHSADSLFRLAIAYRSDGRLIGTAGFHTVSALNRSAELAYDLAPEAWGKGIASQTARALTAWAHQTANILRVQATVLESNSRSARVLDRCGFQREGLLRSYRHVRGRPGDFWIYAKLSPAS